MDDQEDIAEEVPSKDDRGPADPKADGKQPSDADLLADSGADAIVPEAASELSDEAATPGPAARLYQMRPAGLRPVRRRLRRRGLRNDCPPDQRRWPRSSYPRTRLR